MLNDIQYAIRQFRKSPGFALTAILTLALGIGANTAIFSVMHAVLLRALPVRDPQQLFYLQRGENAPDAVSGSGNPTLIFGINIYNRLRADRSIFSDVIAYVPLSFTKTAVRFGDAPEDVETDEVSGNFFSGLGVGMATGKAFAPVDEEKHSHVAILSYGYWIRRFNRSPAVIGQPLYVNGVPMTIIGIAAPHFYGVESGGVITDVWIPLQNEPELNSRGFPATFSTLYGNPNWWSLMLMVRLRPSITQQQALAAADPLFQRAAWETVSESVPRSGPPLMLSLAPAQGLGTAAHDFQQPLRVLMGMVALVLVIACVNLLMLLAARNAAREREFSMRLALGAGRWPLFRQLLAESMLLVVMGAGLGWLFALEATKLLAVWSELEVSLGPDASVLLFTLLVSAGAALLFGLAPLRSATNAPVTLALRTGSSHTENRSRVLTGKILIVAQIAFCVVLLFGAGLLIRTLRNYQNVDLGIQAAQVLVVGVHPIGAHDDAHTLTFYTQLTDQLQKLPGVHSVTLATNRPGSEGTDNSAIILDGHQYRWDGGYNDLRTNIVGPDFFQTLGIPILQGRGITAADTQSAERIAVVNETLAQRYLKGASPIGHTLGTGKWKTTIVGVVRDSKYSSADEKPMAMAWYSYQQASSIRNMDVEIRATGNPMSLLPEIRLVVRGLDPNLPLDDPKLLQAQFEETYLMPGLFARMGAFFGGLAALLVAVGLYGTLSYRVHRRSVEIGLRMALGALRAQVLWMILRDSLVLVGGGLLTGLPLAWFGSKLMYSMLYQLPAHDPVSFAAAAIGVLAVAVVAALFPARRAASVDPMLALHEE